MAMQASLTSLLEIQFHGNYAYDAMYRIYIVNKSISALWYNEHVFVMFGR